ncbi:MurR/RpiR family transcriptional regulator [Bacillus sp. 165]|uniref:MurR/RpiR family transcriptional regulator n=1 Tax=Bacillus sp. 165 TaxID=1529117 RepID=UPI001ADCFE47|nr:MurR/RpiR family transcriptional regulator [Bacillus sp. 165]MBO9130726.1 MurR/RpiR family transcriptional regulator [Bacillus sp. 165]
MFTNEMITSFNELELSLYNYICKNSNTVIYMRIRDLADQTHMSTSTILRFCRKVNCEGFSEFKTKLKLSLEKEEAPVRSAQYSFSEFMERALKGNLEDYIHQAAHLVAGSDNVIFIGSGSSGILAEYGARYFSSLGKLSLHIKDPFFPIHAHHLHNSVTIALSVSGETSSTLTLIHKLKKEGSKIISITNHKNCTASKISDVNIAYYVTEEHVGTSNITTQIPVVYILEETARAIHKLTNSSHL